MLTEDVWMTVDQDLLPTDPSLDEMLEETTRDFLLLIRSSRRPQGIFTPDPQLEETTRDFLLLIRSSRRPQGIFYS
jgi:hypothetical protein